MLRSGVVIALVLATVGCGRSLQAPAAVELTDYRGRGESTKLQRLGARADAFSADFDAQFAAGMGHMWATLDGDLRHREAAEHYLERAWRLDPEAQPSARILSRFLNLRSTALDFSRVDLQIELYESIVPGLAETSSGDREQFTFSCFLEAARAMKDYDRGRTLAAYARVARLERRMEARLRHHPDEIDTHAMAGNYALGLAGSLPFGRGVRLERAVTHLRLQQARWDELSSGARATYVAPNVREVWTFMLAEALTASGELGEARVHYGRVIAADDGESSPRRALADASRERLSRLPEYGGRAELLPAWPGGPASCIACHSERAELPAVGLFRLEAVRP